MTFSFISSFGKPINSIFDDMFDDFMHKELVPLSHLSEKNSKWVLQVDLPSVKRKDIVVTTTPDYITVEAELEEAYNVSRYGHVAKFEHFKKFTKIPSHVDTKKISANFKNGILTIIIPKIHAGKKISIS
ncbi:MAG TPA: Hsp20/alpha crystallin family protein [Candidatus Nitrosotalea sp.]|nr:Hsp20/alpha crystallin family protein [Candidatus Nitrosotalea sp.]